MNVLSLCFDEIFKKHFYCNIGGFMGFYFSGCDSKNLRDLYYLEERDKKQHLNLSDSAWLVVEQDIKNFYLNEKDESMSGFLNIILKNFYETADASISLRCQNKKEELDMIFSSKEFEKFDKQMKLQFVTKTLNTYRDYLKNKAYSYSKGSGSKFRINVHNVKLLKDEIHEEDYYDNSIGLYLKALYEEYCEKPNYEREQIFFKDKIDEISLALNESKKIKISTKEKYDPKNKRYYKREFLVSPYKIVQDDTKSFNYLVGFSEEISNNSDSKEKTISSFRISHIDKVRKMSSMKSFISKENVEKIENELITKKPQFMAGDVIDVKIRFTEKGIESLNRQLYMRPQFYEKVSGEDNIYIFKCTEVQAMNYFFKFARDVEVLEPESLRIKFIKRYSSSLRNYGIMIEE